MLRTGTRTLIHIPGLGRYEPYIGVLSELGRFAYYVAVVLVIATLIYLSRVAWISGTTPRKTAAGLIWSFLAMAIAGRIEMVANSAVAWGSAIVLVGLLALTWTGVRSLPIALFVAASAVASWAVLGQGSGGGLSGATIDIAIVVAEGLLILAAVTTPLLLTEKIGRSAVIAGSLTGVLFVAGFSVGGTTLSILTLWNLGVPGWFSPIAYGLALMSLTVTLWSAISSRDTTVAGVVVLLLAGGVGPISTYQTALAIAAVALAGLVTGSPRKSTRAETVSDAESGTARDLVPVS